MVQSLASTPDHDNDPFLVIKTKPSADLRRLEEVMVITKMTEETPFRRWGQAPIRAADILAQRLPSVPKQDPNAQGAGQHTNWRCGARRSSQPNLHRVQPPRINQPGQLRRRSQEMRPVHRRRLQLLLAQRQRVPPPVRKRLETPRSSRAQERLEAPQPAQVDQQLQRLTNRRPHRRNPRLRPPRPMPLHRALQNRKHLASLQQRRR